MLEKKYNIISIKFINFKNSEGNLIQGYKIYGTRSITKDDVNVYGCVLDEIWLSVDNLDDLKKIESKVFPFSTTIFFEIKSLKSKPVATKILL